MDQPTLTFFCELHASELETLFSANGLIPQLRRLNANISMAIQDFSPERARIVKKLTRAGIPVTAWLLLPLEEGYWTSLDTLQQTAERYTQFLEWTRSNDLTWAAIGLDIEPRLDFLQRLSQNFNSQIPVLMKRLVSFRKTARLKMEARSLVASMHEDGYAVETYQIPLMIEERRAESSLLARLFGLTPLEADREVLMLYSSFFPQTGEAILWSYARETTAVGVGSTGGVVEIEGMPASRKLRWLELKRDLLEASQHASHIYIFSLEGCVKQNFLDRLETLDWHFPQPLPVHKASEITIFRKVAQAVLWMLSHPLSSFLIFFPPALLLLSRKRVKIRISR